MNTIILNKDRLFLDSIESEALQLSLRKGDKINLRSEPEVWVAIKWGIAELFANIQNGTQTFPFNATEDDMNQKWYEYKSIVDGIYDFTQEEVDFFSQIRTIEFFDGEVWVLDDNGTVCGITK